MSFKTYSDQNPPKRGTAKKIYDALKSKGFRIGYLRYNPNCWMRQVEDGWATWSCEIIAPDGEVFECWCGWDNDCGAYLQGNSAPFAVVFLSNLTEGLNG